MWRNWISYTAGGNVKWYNYFGKLFSSSSKVNLLQDPKIPFLSIYPREMKIYVHRRGLYKKLELLHSHSSSSKKKCPSLSMSILTVKFLHRSHWQQYLPYSLKKKLKSRNWSSLTERISKDWRKDMVILSPHNHCSWLLTNFHFSL